MSRPQLRLFVGAIAALAIGCSGRSASELTLPARSAGLAANIFGRTSPTSLAASTASAEPVTIGLRDNFSSDALGLPAAGWTVVSGAWSVCQAALAHAYCKTSSTTGESINGAMSWTDYTIDADITDTNVVQGGVGIIGRAQSPSQFYQLELRSQFNGRLPYWYLEKANGTTWTILAGGPLRAPDSNPHYRLNLAFAGPQITASIGFDGGTSYQLLASVNDPSYPFGRVGLRMGWKMTTASAFNSIVVTLGGVPLISESAASSSAFVDTMGMNGHFEAPNYSAKTRVRSLIANLHIRHYRVAASQILVTGGSYLRQLTDFNQSFGTTFDVLSALDLPAAQVVKALQLLPAGSVDSVEGPNEADAPDAGGSTYDPNFAQDVPRYMRALYASIKSSPATSNLVVIGPSFSNSRSYAAIGNISDYVDNGNMHNYFGGFNPGTLGWGGRATFAPKLSYGSIDWNIASSDQATGSKPIQSTETGYYTAPIHGGVPVNVQAKYLPRLYFEQYRHQVLRSYVYQLVGWSATNADGTLQIVNSAYLPSPAYQALSGLIARLGDGGLPSKPRTYAWALTGHTANVDHVLLHKADGTMVLALWIEVPSFDPNANGGRGAQISVPKQSVTVHVAQITNTGVIFTCDPNTGTWSSEPVNGVNRSITLDVSDSVSILEI